MTEGYVTLTAYARSKLCMHRTSVFCSTTRGCTAFIGRAPCDAAEESHLASQGRRRSLAGRREAVALLIIAT